MQTIGTCSLCGGEVQAPHAWYSVTPYVPTCSRCGATMAQHGPVIPMVPRRTYADTEGTYAIPVYPGPDWRLSYELVTADTSGVVPLTVGGES